MIIRGSREIVIDASPEAILDALADIDAWPSWSPLHKHVEVIDTHPDGRPRRVKETLKIMGITEKEVLEYNWGPSWMVFDAEPSLQQCGQHGEYNLTAELGKTRVRFDIIMELAAPLPEFLINRGKKIVLRIATEGLRKWIADRRDS